MTGLFAGSNILGPLGSPIISVLDVLPLDFERYDTINDQYILLLGVIDDKLKPILLFDYRNAVKISSKKAITQVEYYAINYSIDYNKCCISSIVKDNDNCVITAYLKKTYNFIIKDSKIATAYKNNNMFDTIQKILYLKKHEILLNLDLSNNTIQYNPITKRLDYIEGKLEAHDAFKDLKSEVEKV